MTSTEKSNLFRQLLDIQMQADKLIKGSPSEQEVEHFNQYAQELKYYCLENIEQDDIQRLLYEIPEVEMKEDYAAMGCLSLVLPAVALVSGDMSALNHGLHRIDAFDTGSVVMRGLVHQIHL